MRNLVFVVLTIFAGILLSLLPMPEWAVWLRPAWVLMILLFWAMVHPDYVNVGVAWCVGLVMDFLMATPLGEHALAYTFVIYVVSGLHHRLLFFPLWQQSVCVFIFALVYQSIIYGIQGVLHELPNSSLYWGSSLTTMLLWPWLFVLLHNAGQRFKVN